MILFIGKEILLIGKINLFIGKEFSCRQKVNLLIGKVNLFPGKQNLFILICKKGIQMPEERIQKQKKSEE